MAAGSIQAVSYGSSGAFQEAVLAAPIAFSAWPNVLSSQWGLCPCGEDFVRVLIHH